jgi:sortase A
MLLKVGLATIAVSLVLVAGVAAAVSLRDETTNETAVSGESKTTVESPAHERNFDLGQKLEIDDEPNEDRGVVEQDDGNVEDVGLSPRIQSAREPDSKQEPEPARAPAPRSQVKSTPTPEPVPDWPEPTSEQATSAQEPRYYQPLPDADMTLTIDALGLYDVPVLNSDSLEVLDRGLMHEPETSLPWDGGAQRNVFIAGHYLGWPGTASHLVFYNLDKLRRGDEIVLKDSQDRAYRYRVSEAFEALPEDSWVMGQERGRDMLTLQTCVPPTFEDRLVIRADRA